ncbi:MAG: NAD(P)H-dependent oxidoreductase subunit E [Parvibaculaceae bacterium]
MAANAAFSASLDPAADVASIARAHGNRPENLIEMLHEVQDRLGYVSDGAVATLAHAINRSRAEVHGVLTFYHDFHRAPAGRHSVKICGAEACQSMGCRGLVRHAERRLGTRMGETTADRAITLETVYCLGNCALSPAVMIDGELHGRVTPEKFDALMDCMKGEAA